MPDYYVSGLTGLLDDALTYSEVNIPVKQRR